MPPFQKGSFRSRLHDEGPAAWLGIALGVTFTICFVTGVTSHLIQHTTLRTQPLFNAGGWSLWPARPAGLYRLSQGLHVATGIAAIPLLLVKLFVVYHHLWQWPPVRGLRNAVERASLPLLVGGSLFLLATGVQNIFYWYAWRFFFPTAHYWAAWITIGALVMHVFAKAHITRRVVGGRARRREAPDSTAGADGHGPLTGGLTRRSVLTLAGGASGLFVLSTVGQTVAPLERLALLAPRRPSIGPQGFPVNKTAAGAGVVQAAMDEGWTVKIVGRVARELELSLADLRALRLREEELPIACVEGWSASVRWRGVPIRDLLVMAGGAEGSRVKVSSLQRNGLYTSSTLGAAHTSDPATLLALEVEGEPLHIDHGFPARLIAPNLPGVLNTKWVGTVEVL